MPQKIYEWATFISGHDGKVHVAPLGEGEKVRPPHILRMECSCGPTPDHLDEDVIIHNTEH